MTCPRLYLIIEIAGIIPPYPRRSIMKKSLTGKKLTLHRETLKKLEAGELGEAAGGASLWTYGCYTCTCQSACNNCTA